MARIGFLILEDDVVVNDGFVEQLEDVDFGDSLFVRLLHNPGWDGQFAHQFDHKYHIKGDIYRMIPQWHTIAQLVHRDGIEYLLSKLPVTNCIDLWYNQHIRGLKATIYKNSIFKNGGARDYGDGNSEFGSIISGVACNNQWYAYKGHWRKEGGGVVCIVDTLLKKRNIESWRLLGKK